LFPMLLMPLETADPVQAATLWVNQSPAGAGAGAAAALASACPPPGSSLSSGEGVAPCLGGGPWALPWGPLVLAHDLAHEDLCNVWLCVPLAHSCSTQRETSLP